MIRFVHIMLFCGLAIFYGCNSNAHKEYRNDNNQLVIEEWFNDNQLKSRIVYFNEEKTDYSILQYDKNGNIKDSTIYVNNLPQGTRKIYDTSNDLLHIETYQNGILHGPHKAIYSSGVASFVGYQLNGNKVGEWKFFYPEGNPITYEFYDSTGRLNYFLKYEKDGHHLQSEGSGIIHVSDIMEDNGNFFIDVLAAIPPNCSSILNVLLLQEGEEQILFDDEITSIRNTIPLKTMDESNKEVRLNLSITDKKTGTSESYAVSKNISMPAL
ncbi:MAG: hypothetical protein R2750_09130 [Bacteroidales bacterium]